MYKYEYSIPYPEFTFDRLYFNRKFASMDKLKARWGVETNWDIVAIFFGFAINGSLAAFVIKPILKLMGISKDDLSTGLYLLIYILPVFIIYQFTLPYSGWIVGQYKFFKKFQIKMLSRLGLGKFFKEEEQ